MKLAIYIHNPEAFLKGDEDINFSMSVVTKEKWEWWADIGANQDNIFVAFVDVDLESVNRELVTQTAIDAFDKREEEIRAKSTAEITDLERRKSELLSITYQPGE